LVFIVSLSSFSQQGSKRENILDRIIHIEEEVILEIPEVPPLCDSFGGEKKKVDIGECKLFVEIEGKGTPVVLLHGGPGSTHHKFHYNFSKAAEFARIIYYDQRGCGFSDYEQGEGYTVDQAAGDLDKLRKALKIDKWVVLGHSYGGLLGQYYMTKYPESVAGLILVGSAPAMHPHPKGTRQGMFISEEERKKIMQLRIMYFGKKLTMKQLLYNSFLNGDWKRQHFYKPTREEITRAAHYGWIHDEGFNDIMSKSSRAVNLKGAFEQCPIPTLIMEGKWDLTWLTGKPEILHQNHPGSKLVMFELSGHSPFDDEPEKFFGILKDFIQNLPEIKKKDLMTWKYYLNSLEEKPY